MKCDEWKNVAGNLVGWRLLSIRCNGNHQYSGADPFPLINVEQNYLSRIAVTLQIPRAKLSYCLEFQKHVL